MFGADAVSGDTTALLFITQKAVFFAAAIVFSAPVVPYLRRKCDAMREQGGGGAILASVGDLVYPLVMVGLFLVTSAFLLKSDFNPFIYFNF